MARLSHHPLPCFRASLFAEHPEFGRVVCAELLHDVRAVKFDRARADAERSSGFLAGGPSRVARAHQCSIVRRNNEWEFLQTPELEQARREIKKLNGALDVEI